MKRKRNYSRFYAIAKTKGIDLDQHKETLVSQFTGGRSSSLKDMTDKEYEDMCDCLQTGKERDEGTADYYNRLRVARSAALNRIQRIGVDTTDFDKVNRFCLDPRIAGKPFGVLTIDELRALTPKLEAMLRKTPVAKPSRTIRIPVFVNPNQLPS